MSHMSAAEGWRGPYDGSGASSPQWWPSRYGAADRLGSGNELSPERTLKALQLPRTGQVLELTRTIDSTIPFYGARSWNQAILSHESLEGMRGEGPGSDFGAFEEVVGASYQIGCHLDALAHVTIAGRFYNGIHYAENLTPVGMRELGIEYARPWVARGICLDMVDLLGLDNLVPGFEITVKHLVEASEHLELKIGPGDVVLIHTGWGRHWGFDNQRYSAGAPGIGWDAAHWLTDRRVSLVGADTAGFEPIPFADPARPYVVHQHVLVETGTYILENLDTSVLAAADVSEFLFILSPIKTAGSTASMVSPLAVI